MRHLIAGLAAVAAISAPALAELEPGDTAPDFTVEGFQARTDFILQPHHHRPGPLSGIAGGQLKGSVADTHVLASEDAANQGADHVSETEDIET